MEAATRWGGHGRHDGQDADDDAAGADGYLVAPLPPERGSRDALKSVCGPESGTYYYSGAPDIVMSGSAG